MRILLLMFIPLLGLKAENDSLISFRFLDFHSTFEKQLFERIEAGSEVDYFDLFMAAEPSMDKVQAGKTKESFEAFQNLLKSEIKSGSKPRKKIKLIHEKTHNQWFEKYEDFANFDQIFGSGTFNCVSGTMLYALILESMNINFEIKEYPNHVNLVAFPGTEDVLMEVTNPLKGTQNFNEQFKSDYVDYLSDYKIISREERASKTVHELFDEHYFTLENIDMRQLASMQYWNNAVFALQEEDLKTALPNLEKAYYLNPQPKTRFLLLNTILINSVSIRPEAIENAEYLSELIDLKQQLYSQEMIIGSFEDLAEQQLIVYGDTNLFEKSYTLIMESVQDSNLTNELRYTYHNKFGNYYYHSSHYAEAIFHLDQALSQRPNNLNLQHNLMLCIYENHKGHYADTNLLDLLSGLKKRHPGLNENIKTNTFYFAVMLDLMSNAFDQDRVEEGIMLKTRFEQEYQEGSVPLREISEAISRAYVRAGIYYFKNDKVTLSRRIMDDGLNICPDCVRLKETRDSIDY